MLEPYSVLAVQSGARYRPEEKTWTWQLLLICHSSASLLSILTLRERTAPLLGTLSKFSSPSGGCTSSVFAADETLVKHESTDAARSRFKSGTVRKISRTKGSSGFWDFVDCFVFVDVFSLSSSVVPSGCSESDVLDTFSSDVPVGSTKIASCLDIERRRDRGPGISISSSSLENSMTGDVGKTGGDEGNAGGDPGTMPGRGKAG